MPNNTVVHPFNKKIKELLSIDANYKNGNFGLWFNKFIPVSSNENFHTCDENGKKEEAANYYKKFYNRMQNNSNSPIQTLLENKHLNQYYFYKSFESKYETIVITAKLISPLIAGIGLTHPNEVGMLFDHTMGIPYISASSIKGDARFAHTIGLLDDLYENHKDEIKKTKIKKDDRTYEESCCFDDEEDWTKIPLIFGKGGDKGNVGRVIFLDAYPELDAYPKNIPELHEDIMNPHYGEYYSDNNGTTAPADYLEPKPIKFLTVKKGTKFIFRILVNKKHNDLKDNKTLKDLVLTAVRKSLEEEGVGAKTAVGYGLFNIENFSEPESIKKLINKKEDDAKKHLEELENIKKIEELKNMSEVDKICYKLKNDYEESYAMEIYNKINDPSYNEEDKKKIASAFKEAWGKV
ncbi:MAG: type III-B CRISPR module RAMP protein Cmr6 [bacterium]